MEKKTKGNLPTAEPDLPFHEKESRSRTAENRSHGGARSEGTSKSQGEAKKKKGKGVKNLIPSRFDSEHKPERLRRGLGGKTGDQGGGEERLAWKRKSGKSPAKRSPKKENGGGGVRVKSVPSPDFCPLKDIGSPKGEKMGKRIDPKA